MALDTHGEDPDLGGPRGCWRVQHEDRPSQRHGLRRPPRQPDELQRPSGGPWLNSSTDACQPEQDLPIGGGPLGLISRRRALGMLFACSAGSWPPAAPDPRDRRPVRPASAPRVPAATRGSAAARPTPPRRATARAQLLSLRMLTIEPPTLDPPWRPTTPRSRSRSSLRGAHRDRRGRNSRLPARRREVEIADDGRTFTFTLRDDRSGRMARRSPPPTTSGPGVAPSTRAPPPTMRRCSTRSRTPTGSTTSGSTRPCSA